MNENDARREKGTMPNWNGIENTSLTYYSSTAAKGQKISRVRREDFLNEYK